MIWFFTRENAQVDIEVRRSPDTGTFELVVDYPDGSEGVEAFSDPRKLVKRTLSLQRELIRKGWVPTGPGLRAATTASLSAGARRRPNRRFPIPRLWRYVRRQVTERLAATFGL